MAHDQVMIRKRGTHYHVDPSCKMLLRSNWDDRHALVPRDQAENYKPCPWCSESAISAGTESGKSRDR